MRTRFAPSPTGFLHVGGLRTALFSYLMAKKHGGTFYLRIEDTDRERHVEGATEHLQKMLQWAGLTIDDGPYIQSERLEIYRRHAEQLLQSGNAYRCFCAKERLDTMREEQARRKQAPMYDRTCLNMAKEESERRAKNERHTIRFPVPHGETIECNDRIRGNVTFATNTIDDQVLLKSDGYPTYHLAHVVDDHLMETTLVVRGEEWLPSLPKHLLLFRAFGWEAPEYAHVPLLLAKGGGKLSKRDGDVSVEAFIEKGYLREALINFIALLGWNPGTSRASRSGTGQRPEKEQEIFSMEELIEKFSLERVQKGGAIFDTAKLDWLQGQWMRRMPLQTFAERIRPIVAEKFAAAEADTNFPAKAKLVQERITFFKEAPEMLRFFYEEPSVNVDLLANEEQGVTKEDLPKIFEILISTLESIPEDDWTEETLKEKLGVYAEPGRSTAEETHALKRGQLLWPLRAALTGLPFSPGAFEVASLLGKETAIRRIHNSTKSQSPNPNHQGTPNSQ